MKIRTITVGLALSPEDFEHELAASKLKSAKHHCDQLEADLVKAGYVVQTKRIALNPMHEWNPDGSMKTIDRLQSVLTKLEITFCAIGPIAEPFWRIIPDILQHASSVSCSIAFQKDQPTDVCPHYQKCVAAAQVCVDVAESLGDLGNFRFCASFNCAPGVPFFPAAYARGGEGEQSDGSDRQFTISLGLENGDLLFMAYFGANNMNDASANLYRTLKQALSPIQSIAQSYCERHSNDGGVMYGGIDASINPGLTQQDSIGAGIECLLFACGFPEPEDKENNRKKNIYGATTSFGSTGTLAAVAATTNAMRMLREDPAEAGDKVILTGYSGLMLPVMEDLTLADRASGPEGAEGSSLNQPAFGIRDLLVFSSVCGVGLDTVPIPGNASAHDIAGLYMETAAIAFRLNKPLSCRVLPMRGKTAGDMTEVDSPYLCNTRVFELPSSR